MKILTVIFTLLQLFACSQTIKKTMVDDPQNHVLTYSLATDSLQNQSGKLYLDIDYTAKSKDDCNLFFRIFCSVDSMSVDTALRSKNYIGSYSVGQGCNDRFRVPLKRFDNPDSHQKLVFYIVPLTSSGAGIRKDLSDNFSLSLSR